VAFWQRGPKVRKILVLRCSYVRALDSFPVMNAFMGRGLGLDREMPATV
jgi:hypothetical protein